MAAMDTGIPEHGYSQDGQTDGQSIPLKIKYKIFQLQPIECDVMREEGRSDKHVENTCQTSQQKRQKIPSRNTYVRVTFRKSKLLWTDCWTEWADRQTNRVQRTNDHKYSMTFYLAVV